MCYALKSSQEMYEMQEIPGEDDAVRGVRANKIIGVPGTQTTVFLVVLVDGMVKDPFFMYLKIGFIIQLIPTVL